MKKKNYSAYGKYCFLVTVHDGYNVDTFADIDDDARLGVVRQKT